MRGERAPDALALKTGQGSVIDNPCVGVNNLDDADPGCSQFVEHRYLQTPGVENAMQVARPVKGSREGESFRALLDAAETPPLVRPLVIDEGS
jgi:hypothetical protein